MALYVSTNVSSLNAYRNLANATGSLDTVFKRLASGLRINSAKDDAAGLQISDRLTSQINGLNQGNRNAQDGISFCQTAEGALDEMTNIYQRIRTLAIQSANGTNSTEDRKAIQEEVSQLCEEITRIGNDTTFGGTHILDKSLTAPTEFQVGADANETVSIDLTSGFRLTDVFMKLYNDTADPAELSFLMSGLPKTVIGSSPAFDVTADYFASEGNHAITVRQMADRTVIKKNFTSADQTFVPYGMGNLLIMLGVGNDTPKFYVNVGVFDKLSDVVNNINSSPDNFGVTASLSENGDGTVSFSLTSGIGDVYKKLEVWSGGPSEDMALFRFSKHDHEGPGSMNSQGWYIESIGQDTIIDIDGDLITSSGNTVYSPDTGLTITANQLSESDGSGGFVATNITVNPTDLSSFSVETANDAQNTLAVVDKFIAAIDSKRAELGAVQNRLESAIRNQSNVSENVSAARSRIRDADFATETAAMIQKNILQQASRSILSQANQRPQIVLSLLQS